MTRAITLAAVATLGLTLLLSAAVPEAPPAPDPRGVEYFEKHIRPVLVNNCVKCHGPAKEQAGLRLDTRAGFLRGGDNGPLVVPGKPDESALIRAVKHTAKLKMPPKEKLKAEQIDQLIAWVEMGAPWPDDVKTGTKSPSERIAEIRESHWSFQPVRNPAVPAVKDAGWVRNPVDAFVRARLETKGFAPAPPADRRTLLRRVTFDLTGLPPTPDEVAAFENDPAADAFEKVVDRLLASSDYGERWGRHWLDVARYADTKGYIFQEERRYAYSYTYRDYVIAAFNDDKPYDQFVLEQLAADQLQLEDKRALAAMGYLTLGRRFLNNTHDIIDDRIDVTMRGFQGLTVACARCHDHKFDPIPTKDYYSLYGVFGSSIEPKELPLIAMPEQTEAYLAYEKELKSLEQKVAEFLQTRHAELLSRFRARTADYLLAVRDAHLLPGEDHYEAITAGDLHPLLVKRWKAYLDQQRKGHHPVYTPWLAFAALPQKEFAAKAPDLVKHFAANADEKRRINPLLARALGDKAPATLRDLAQLYGTLFAEMEKDWKEASQRGDKVLKDAAQEELRQAIYGPVPASLPIGEVVEFLDRAARDKLTPLQRKVDQFKATSPNAPPRAMVLNDTPTPMQPHVLVRGNPANRGAAVPRQYLLVLAGDERKPFGKGSGRLELARAIASKDNPLTARVMANRIWMHHFGAGLVRTPSDFGLRGDPPTHPELLDFLAASFMENGWSVKKLHRLILLSNAYRQGSAGDPKLTAADPENLLLGRMNRRRLEFESLRDSLLFVSGRLDRKTRGGPGVELLTTNRRTVYGFIERQNLPGIFRTFDFASPDTSTAQRHMTTVPQQALFLMNSPFVVEQAKALARRAEGESEPAKKIEHLYRLCFGRKPDADEVALGKQFVASVDASKGLTGWEKYAQVLLLANEFAFID